MIATTRLVNAYFSSHSYFCCLYAWYIPLSFICLIYSITTYPSEFGSGVSSCLKAIFLSQWLRGNPLSESISPSVKLY